MLINTFTIESNIQWDNLRVHEIDSQSLKFEVAIYCNYPHNVELHIIIYNYP